MEKLREEGWLDARPSGRPATPLNGIYGAAFEARTGFLVEYRMRRADGAYRWLLATGVPRYGPDGSFAGYVGCDIDITERKDAEDRIRESRPLEQPSGDPAPGRPADRGPGCRAGADRARPARRREPAAGRLVDRPQRPQAPNGRVAASARSCRRICGRFTSAPPRSRRTSVTSPTTCIPRCCGTPGWWPP